MLQLCECCYIQQHGAHRQLRARKALKYQYSKMCWDPEGHYCCIKSIAIVPFWFSMEHLWILIAPFWYSVEHLWTLMIVPFWLSTDDMSCASSYFHWQIGRENWVIADGSPLPFLPKSQQIGEKTMILITFACTNLLYILTTVKGRKFFIFFFVWYFHSKSKLVKNIKLQFLKFSVKLSNRFKLWLHILRREFMFPF